MHKLEAGAQNLCEEGVPQPGPAPSGNLGPLRQGP